jgi:hypothetical protein
MCSATNAETGIRKKKKKEEERLAPTALPLAGEKATTLPLIALGCLTGRIRLGVC